MHDDVEYNYLFPNQLLGPAKSVGMDCPEDPDSYFDKEDILQRDYPHFWVFCQLQLGRETTKEMVYHNAAVIQGIPNSRLFWMTLSEYIDAGLDGLKD